MRQRCKSVSLDVHWRGEFLTERFDGMIVLMRLIWLELVFYTGRRNARRNIPMMNFKDDLALFSCCSYRDCRTVTINH